MAISSYHHWLMIGIGGMFLAYIIFQAAFGVSLSPLLSQTNVSKTPVKTPTAKPPANGTTNGKPNYILYFFYQPDCPYCEQMSPIVSAWALDGNQSVRLDLQLTNTWDNSALANKYAVRTTPTTVLVNKATNTEVKRWVGVFDINELDCYFHAN